MTKRIIGPLYPCPYSSTIVALDLFLSFFLLLIHIYINGDSLFACYIHHR